MERYIIGIIVTLKASGRTAGMGPRGVNEKREGFKELRTKGCFKIGRHIKYYGKEAVMNSRLPSHTLSAYFFQ
jgi:hypothetical protein